MEDKQNAKIEFQDALSKIIIDFLDKMYEPIAVKFGKDVAFGYLLGIDDVHFALTGKTIKEVTNSEEE